MLTSVKAGKWWKSVDVSVAFHRSWEEMFDKSKTFKEFRSGGSSCYWLGVGDGVVQSLWVCATQLSGDRGSHTTQPFKNTRLWYEYIWPQNEGLMLCLITKTRTRRDTVSLSNPPALLCHPDHWMIHQAKRFPHRSRKEKATNRQSG